MQISVWKEVILGYYIILIVIIIIIITANLPETFTQAHNLEICTAPKNQSMGTRLFTGAQSNKIDWAITVKIASTGKDTKDQLQSKKKQRQTKTMLSFKVKINKGRPKLRSASK